MGGVGNRSEVAPSKVSEISFAIPVSRNRSNSNTGHASDQELKRKRFSEVTEESSSLLRECSFRELLGLHALIYVYQQINDEYSTLH